jgi:sec-independent protein translocase protein TatA
MQISAVLLFLGELGGGEIMVIMVAVLVLFGANKIPGIARSLGSGIREFKDATSGIRHELERSINEEAPARPQTPVSSVKEEPTTLPEEPITRPEAPGPERKLGAEPEDSFQPSNID